MRTSQHGARNLWANLRVGPQWPAATGGHAGSPMCINLSKRSHRKASKRPFFDRSEGMTIRCRVDLSHCCLTFLPIFTRLHVTMLLRILSLIRMGGGVVSPLRSLDALPTCLCHGGCHPQPVPMGWMSRLETSIMSTGRLHGLECGEHRPMPLHRLDPCQNSSGFVSQDCAPCWLAYQRHSVKIQNHMAG